MNPVYERVSWRRGFGQVAGAATPLTGAPGDYDALLDYFPFAFYEPYYASYLNEDLDRLMRPGFTPEERSLAYFSKVVTYRRGAFPPNHHKM
jgi:hypothetical protein